MYIKQYINSTADWLDNNVVRIYCNGDYTWNSPSVNVGGNYLPIFQGLPEPLYQDTTFQITITNNDQNSHYNAANLIVSFGMNNFNLNQIMSVGPHTLVPEESYTYDCTIPITVFMPQQFALVAPMSEENVDVTITVSFPDILTGWMTTTSSGMYQYDSSLSEWTYY